MNSSRILVSGFPDGTSKTMLMIYFQSVRESGGGDVESIEIDRRTARITFTDAQVADRVLNRPHTFKNCTLQVTRMPQHQGRSSRLEEKRRASLDEYENQDTCRNNSRQRNSSTEEPPSSQESASAASVQSESPIPEHCIIEVTGLPDGASEDLVTNYFENVRRSKGGPVSSVVMTPELRKCLVTFESPDDAERTINHSSHVLSGARLQVSLFVEEDESADEFGENEGEDQDLDEEDSITIIVSDIPSSTSEDTVTFYFENSRRSGGGDVSEIHYKDSGEAVITFSEVKDLQRLLEEPHKIDGQIITVMRQPPPKKVPLDPLRLHVQGLSVTTSKDCLSFYLEKFADVEVEEVYLGVKNNALAVFESEPDFESLLHKVNNDKKGLEGKKPRLERVPVCSCILVTGLKRESTDHTIDLYFDNEKRSGGRDVSRVERIRKDQALVHFEDHTSVQDVIARSQRQAHKIDGVELEVTPYYPFLENAASKGMEVTFDPDIYKYIKDHHKSELQTLLTKYSVEAEFSDGLILNISPVDSKCDPSWEEGAESLKSFLFNFKKIEMSVPSEIFDEVSKRWQLQCSSQGTTNFLLLFDNHRRQAVILGKKTVVEQEEEKLKELITKVKEDSELMKSVVEVVETNYTKSRLTLLEMSGLCNELADKYRHLSINVDSAGEKLCFKGPRKNIQEVKLEVVTFISKVIERTTEQPTGIIDVLRQQRVSTFIQELFKKKSIQAVVLLDQGRSSNEVQVVGVDVRNAKEAEAILQDSIMEKSIHLTPENTQVTNSREWKDFQLSMTSKFKVEIALDASVSNVWIRGITDDVEECSDQVQKFLEKNTIFHNVVQVEEGTAKFIATLWKKKLEAIKGELSNCYVDMRATSDYSGIEVSGTAEGMAKCVPQIHDLIGAVQKESIPVDKPGMKKFFKDGKGQGILKSVEDSHKCVILTRVNNEVESVPDFSREDEHFQSAAEFVCSCSTKHGKKISVMKGDITKDRVDAIVNAANERLQHVGGVAAAIVTEGGRDIQDECDTFIRRNGTLLEGHVFVSGAGKLPCSKVIHAVGPKWSPAAEKKRQKEEVTQEERYLKQAIRNVLAEAKHLTSLAIPGVSCGIYGFPRDLCAKIILNTVLEFCEKNSNCRLSEIHLIDKDDQTVQAFEGEFKERFADEQTFRARKVGKSFSGSAPSNSGYGRAAQVKTVRTSRSFVTQGIRVTVKSGDLADEQADILVGTAASNLNLSQNPCAMALSQRAGPALQKECDKIGQVAVGDIAVVDQPGNLKCKAVFFAVCSEWQGGKGKKVLKRLIRKCLEEATRAGVESIAFPAIGTGILAFPHDEVAEIYFDEVTSHNKKNPSTTLKQVRFLLYDKDYSTIQAFEEELKRRNMENAPIPVKKAAHPIEIQSANNLSSAVYASSSPNMTFSPLRERRPDHLETNVGALCFQAQPGDITDERTDAIAIITNRDLDVKRGGGAGAAILRKGGDSIQRECQSYGPQLPGSVVVTKAGNLNARFVFHIVLPQPLNNKSIKLSVMKCLREAEKRGLSSISFPVIGTGNLGVTAKSCAETMLSAVCDFNNHQPVSLKLLKLIIFQKEMIKDVRQAIEEASGQAPDDKPGVFRRVFSTVSGFLGFGEKDTELSKSFQKDANNTLHLAIFAGCKEDIQGATRRINEIMKENSTTQIIEHEAVTTFSGDNFRKIHTLEQIHDVSVSVEEYVGRIVIRGQPSDILNVSSEIHTILHNLKEEEHERRRAEALSKDIRWMNHDGDKFVEYGSLINAKIEAAYCQKKPGVTITSEEEEDFQIDFSSMTMTDPRGVATSVQRIDLRKGVLLPAYWIPQPKDSQGVEMTVHLVELDPEKDSQQYKRVQDQFQQTCSGNQIVKIERVQNPALFGSYMIRKQKMDETKGSNEQWLFHGTPGNNCKLINHTGFNRSFHGKNATVYGNGVYFAEDASYSARSTYSPTDASGLRYMYYSRVLVGEYTQGKQGLLTPPAKNPNDPTDTYDSVVDQIPNPKIFVVFYDWQCYPEYLITFR